MAKKDEKTSLDKVMIVIGFIALGYFVVNFLFGLVLSPSYEYDQRIGETDEDLVKRIKTHIEIIEERSYEVIFFGLLLENTTGETALIKMKSLGSKNSQVWEGLNALTRIYPNAPEYNILLLEPTQSCRYIIDEKLWKGYIDVKGEYLESLEFIREINYQIENPTCS